MIKYLFIFLLLFVPATASAQHIVLIEDRQTAEFTLGGGIALLVGGYFGGVGANTEIVSASIGPGYYSGDDVHTISLFSAIPLIGNWMALPYMEREGQAYSPIIFGSLQLIGFVMVVIGAVYPVQYRVIRFTPDGFNMRW